MNVMLFLVNEMQNTFTFSPLTAKEKPLLKKRTLCLLQVKLLIWKRELRWPCLKSIAGDGNCFFRSLSHVVSGTETNHRKIRLAVVKHDSTSWQIFVMS